MSETSRPIVIVGAGLAGGTAAVTLRKQGFQGRVVLVGREPGIPFGRPPLSKTYLRGEEDLSAWYVKPADWYAEHEIELFTECSAVGIETSAHGVVLASGEVLEYQKLLIATGGRNRRLAVPGVDLPGVHSLRTLAECEAIRRDAVAGRHAVVVGMGFIGCEVAASLRQMGLRVTAVLRDRLPLGAVLGEAVGTVMASVHQENGVELLTQDQVVGFEGAERLEAMVTAAGTRLKCDMAVAGVGIEPEVQALTGSQVALDNGILVDELSRTNIQDVYAAGDVANHLHPVFGRIRVEHFNNAEKEGTAAAESMLGHTDPYAYIHSFWSDQYEHKLEYVGHASRWDQFVVRGNLEERRFIGFYMQAGTLRAAVGLNRGGDPELEPESELAACANLIAHRADLRAETLADERVELQSLMISAEGI
jgi:3-phenylpropionate/trans-cinnamate dioxygenase ferredoxin reductase subunit